MIDDTDRPVLVRLEGVSKRFTVHKDHSVKERLLNIGRSRGEPFLALNGIDLEVRAGSTIGLLGANGSGKSTLLKIIGGILRPSSGIVESRGTIAALLELGAGFHQDLTGRENVYLNAAILGLDRESTDAVFGDIVEFSGIGEFIDTQVKFYSSGMYVRLAFAVAVHTDPDILLVDEVLAVGDEAFQQKCMAKIREFQEQGRTIVLVSHSLNQVMSLCDRALVLRAGHVVYDGDAIDAVNVLRDDFEREHIDEFLADETGPRARVAGIAVHRNGTPLDRPVRPGEDFDVVVTVESEREISGWTVGLAIDTASGTNVSWTTTGHYDHIRLRNGETVVTFRIRSQMFGTGAYFVSGALRREDGSEAHRLVHGASFAAETPVQGHGISYVDYDYAVD